MQILSAGAVPYLHNAVACPRGQFSTPAIDGNASDLFSIVSIKNEECLSTRFDVPGTHTGVIRTGHQLSEEKEPLKVDRMTASVLLDAVWDCTPRSSMLRCGFLSGSQPAMYPVPVSSDTGNRCMLRPVHRENSTRNLQRID